MCKLYTLMVEGSYLCYSSLSFVLKYIDLSLQFCQFDISKISDSYSSFVCWMYFVKQRNKLQDTAKKVILRLQNR